ncbi:nicotinate-nucleotide pyrophosphorylase [carboxylating] [Salsuginibacillus halophilus]|uniref:nicotinate-nucleotide diphosphorylase (carboxylating) n=1 Tax=Salsuginibacillus halophilus TaxID=517424 RepID=A0A2P8HG04_9BACI|nr:carboxylating nicotinate-nucleotide diphosphorylase [Salsuginibacillus halophilus]PSL45130.1 nicotinate-nucleotide pyrophosphorylase [carboxylating] [Salsuginibacillus halophilus]
MNMFKVENDLRRFFLEDLGDDPCRDMYNDNEQTGGWIAKEDGVFAGAGLLERGVKLLDANADVMLHVKDGECFAAGDELARVTARSESLLQQERVILNLIQRMSGIATHTQKAVKELSPNGPEVVDTRKTTPGLRMYEKYAVRCGGGKNHRRDLSDLIMLKENDIQAAGSLTQAVAAAKAYAGLSQKVEVEASTLEEVQEAANTKADIVMFDNMTPEQVHKACKLVKPFQQTEVSGGITLENLHMYRTCPVDFISLGALTHSSRALDISFYIMKGAKV